MNPTHPAVIEWSVQHVTCPLRASDPLGAIRELAHVLAANSAVHDSAALVDAVIAREAQAPTYLGGGVAMPHARTSAVDRLVIAVGLSHEGLNWGSREEMARLVFLVGIPRNNEDGYLDVVRRITQVVRRLEWLEEAMTCRDSAALAALLSRTMPL